MIDSERVEFTAEIEVGLFGGITPALKVNGFWLTAPHGGVSRAMWRVGQTITAEACLSDQFCFEVQSSNGKDKEDGCT